MKKDMTGEEALALLTLHRSDTDRLRERSRSVATLLATVIGGLTVGLFFTDIGNELAPATKATGYIGVLLVISSVCAFVASSLHALPTKSESDVPATLVSSVQGSADNAFRVAKSIATRNRIGKWLAILGLTALALIVPVEHFQPPNMVPVNVQVIDENVDEGLVCPAIGSNFSGEIDESELTSTSSTIPVEISPHVCGPTSRTESVEILFNRDDVLIAIGSNSDDK